MDDVAREAGVSRALVSLVMRNSDKVSEHRRAVVLATAERLGYRANASARNLASHRSETVGVLLNDLHNPYFAEIISGIEAHASEAGYRVLLVTGGRDGRREAAMLEALLEYRPDGLILVSPCLAGPRIVTEIGTTPCVVVGRRVRSTRVDCVMTDDARGAHLAVGHLAELGHEDIAHVDGGRGVAASSRRCGYVDAMRDSCLAHRVRVLPGEFTEDAGVYAAETLLRERHLPTAVFAANDLVALGLIDRLERDGVRIPDDVSVIGYDNTHIAGLSHIALTSVDQPGHAMGRDALALMLERTSGRENRAIRLHDPGLVTRSTTAPPR